jgi:nucleoside-diphosphate-sugar epimerase
MHAAWQYRPRAFDGRFRRSDRSDRNVLADVQPSVPAVGLNGYGHNGNGNGNGNGKVVRGLRHDLRPGRTYLVTGCAGFIGSHLVEALLARGCSVLGVDAFTDNYSRAAKESNLAHIHGAVRFAEADLAESPLEPLLESVDGIFHLAGRPGVRTSWGPTFAHYTRDNLLVTQRVFEAAARRGIRVVYASSSSVYGNADSYPLHEDARLFPVSPYGVSKLACEEMATAYALSRDLDAVGLRYFAVYGPRQRPDMAFSRVFGSLADGQPFPLLGSGRQTRDFTYVGDVVRATLAAMQHARSSAVYNVGGGSEISLLDALALCERVAGRKLEVRRVPTVAGDAPRTIADIGKARVELGWRPAMSLEDGLRAQIGAAAALEAERSLAWAQAR